ncbi:MULTISPECIES: hypothetical protein [unclassified Streptomyces]|uniref:hypothetical protein n=1 Tax=unclassified Streptomyces TaxID=2593676 RepID=UPI00093FFCD4|nr:hypothetical protein [Streptomyces sp. CB02058]OKI96343.1 hypothetical protein AMK10_12030 [Streptomyces sp. CB02058]
MGWTVLYIAFGIVALWLLGEVLLQYKARLRWRLLAFAGFLGVVLGVLIPSVLVIAVGAIAFATGQTYVTLSFRRGFSTGWAIGGNPGESRRRRGGGAQGAQKPTLEVSDLEYQGAPEAETAHSAVYEPQPMPDDTGQYGIYSDSSTGNGGDRQGQGHDQHGEPQPQYAAYDPYTDYGQQAQDPYGQGGYPAQDTHQGQGTYTGQYDYGTDPAGYPAYSDPYIGTGGTGGAASTGQYASYDSYGNGYDSYGGGQQPADPYAGQYASDTPPGGVWVPQQRESEQYPPLPPEAPVQPAPYGNGYDTGQNEQYRY